MVPAALLLLLGLTTPQAGDRTAPRPQHSVLRDDAGRELNRILRRSRDADRPTHLELVDQLEALGADAIGPAIQILVQRSVPALDDATPQILSEPQRTLIVDALERWPAAPALERLEDELLAPPSFERAWAALHVWSALGDGRQLLRGAELAKAHLESKKRRELLRNAVQIATERLVRRRPDALVDLRAGYDSVDKRLRLPLLAGVGATGDARAAELFAHVLDTDEELAPAALAQAQVLARSPDPVVHERLCDELRERLSSEVPSVRIAAIRALGAQRDWRSVERMLDLLEQGASEEQTSVLWALRRATGLEWHGVDSWRAWHASEERWREERLEFVLGQLSSNAQRQVVAALEESAAHPLFADRTAPWAVDALRATSPTVRRAAAAALARLDCPLAYPALIESLDDDDTQVAEAAHNALMSLSGRSLAPQADVWRAALLL